MTLASDLNSLNHLSFPICKMGPDLLNSVRYSGLSGASAKMFFCFPLLAHPFQAPCLRKEKQILPGVPCHLVHVFHRTLHREPSESQLMVSGCEFTCHSAHPQPSRLRISEASRGNRWRDMQSCLAFIPGGSETILWPSASSPKMATLRIHLLHTLVKIPTREHQGQNLHR